MGIWQTSVIFGAAKSGYLGINLASVLLIADGVGNGFGSISHRYHNASVVRHLFQHMGYRLLPH